MFQPEWAAVGVLAVAQMYSFYRNGKAARKALDDRLTLTEQAIMGKITEMKVVCAGARATFKTRLDNHDRELKNLKK